MSIKKKNRFFHVSFMGMNVSKEIQVSDSKESWAKEILDELEENIDQEDREEVGINSELKFIGEIIKKNDSHLDDFMILTGELNVTYITHCISTGEAMADKIQVPVGAVFIQEDIRDKYGYEEDVDLSVEEEVYDLFFIENDQIDIAPVINELVFLNKNQYPKKSTNE